MKIQLFGCEYLLLTFQRPMNQSGRGGRCGRGGRGGSGGRGEAPEK